MEAHSEQSALASATFQFVSNIMSGTISAVLAFQITVAAGSTAGVPVGGWAWLLAFIFFVAGCIVAGRYWVILGRGSFAPGSQQRREYNKLRTQLQRGGSISQTYVRLMRRVLGWIDRIFGDRGIHQQTRVGQWIGLTEQAPLWTAQSYDRSLFFAIIYPCMMIVGTWVGSGHVGPIEASLRLPAYSMFFQRMVPAIGLAIMLLSWIQFMRQLETRRQAIWGGATILSLIITLKTANANIGTVAFATALGAAFALGVGIVVARARIKASGSAGAGTSAFAATGALIIALTGSNLEIDEQGLHFAVGPLGVLKAFLLASAISLIVAATLAWSHRRGKLGGFLLFYTVLIALATLLSPVLLAGLPSWSAAGPILLFLVLLAVVNAPFDWLALGVTRVLFRRGLQGSSWAPLWMGLIDLCIAVAVVIALSIVTVLSVQMFEQLAFMHGGTPIVDVREILNALADPVRRWEPQYWWIYLMVFSTLLPSVFNIAAGSLSVLRGIPGLNGWAARRMPVGKAVLETERVKIVPVLTFQVMLSGIVGVVIVGALFWAIWSLEISGSGNLLTELRHMADANWPYELLKTFGAP